MLRMDVFKFENLIAPL